MASESTTLLAAGLFVDALRTPSRFRTLRELLHKKIPVVAIAFLATLSPARRAARLDPVEVLRYE